MKRIITGLFLIISLASFGQRFDDLTLVDTANGLDQMYIKKKGVTNVRRIELSHIKNYVLKNAGFDTTAIGVDSLSKLFWNINGNAGTNPATNFIGTIDNQNLSIKTNNTEVLLIDNGGNVTLNSGGDFIITDGGSSNVDINQGTLSLTYSGETIYITHDQIQKTGKFTILTDSLYIVDGTQANGYVLTSDANGLASWGVLALTDTATLDFGSISGGGYQDLTVAVTGAVNGDVVSIGVPTQSADANTTFFGFVSSSDTVTVRCLYNSNSGSTNPDSGIFKVKVFK